jgi:(p)ppGpp synthase/HD superfamily hydrolase
MNPNIYLYNDLFPRSFFEMDINIWPYIELSRFLINKERRGFGNMFRHQFDTFVILLEHEYNDPILLKASLIHDLFEDGPKVGFFDFESVKTVDADGDLVYDLVKEVSIRAENGVEETKKQFLERIMKEGTPRSKILKLADRLSNINSLIALKDSPFAKNYTEETRSYILPYARGINKGIAEELEKILMRFI